MYRRLHGETYPFTAMLMASLAELRMIQGDLGQAKHLLERGATTLRQQSSQEAWLLPHLESVRGVYLYKSGDTDAAEQLLLRSYESMRDSHGAYRMYTMLAAERIIGFYESQGRPEEATKYRSLPINAPCTSRPDLTQSLKNLAGAKQISSKRLTLHRTTLRRLSPSELERAGGGNVGEPFRSACDSDGACTMPPQFI